MHVFVTGGAGFIGSSLIAKLLDGGHKVTAIDNFSAGEAAKRRAKMLNKNGRIVYELDAHGSGTIRGTLKNIDDPIDAVVHLAAPISVPESFTDPHKYRREINAATAYLLEAAREKGIRRVVIASTAAVYGDPKRQPVAESEQVNPLSPYAIEKYAAERHAVLAAQQHGLETVALRFFNVYGPGQDPSSRYSGVISKFMACAKRGERPVLYGDGSQTRDFVYVLDVVRAIEAAITQKVRPGLVANVGSGVKTSINDLAQAVGKVASVRLDPRREPARPGDILHSVADIGLAKKELGYEPQTPLEQGLRQTWAWFQENGSQK